MEFTHPIYPITNTELSGMSHTGQVECIIDSGVDLIQLRDKTADSASFYDDACDALRIAKAAGIKLIINDRVDLALALGADGVHLGQDDLPPEEARRILGPESIIGYSTHTFDQALEAARMPIDYIAIGPVFDTTTKKDPDRVTDVDAIIRVKKHVSGIPIIAIGGIGFENIEKVANTGADGAAVISSIWRTETSPAESIDTLNSRWRNNSVIQS
jgi:thiamine-phosphate pyrophosphorylase